MRSESRRGGRRLSLIFGIALLLMITTGVGAAERTRPVLIGALNDSWGPTPAAVGLRDGLVELGYRENEHFVIGIRFTQGDTAALPTAAKELVQQGIDILFATGPSAASAAQMATNRIPIVFAEVGDPLRLGLVQSFARPGGNITGVTNLDLELGPKRLEIFREIIPGLKRVLFAYNSTESFSIAEAKAYREAARRLGIILIEKPVRTQQEAQTTFGQVRKGEVHGILEPRSLSLNIPGFALETASQRVIPTMFHTAFWVERGGLASYGPNFYESGRQAARLVDKILKGASPAATPVEVNTKIEFAINVKVARALGLAIPPEVLYRADRVFR
ncbi:MAG: ABC transporter substrate-binding protein [candidate division NC10 bacterium]|nr:ABC transporter substrate-binding protein [candidate division NC10 bacterium]